MSPIIEAAARALCVCDGHADNAEFNGEAFWRDYVPKAREVLLAAREATDAMAKAGRTTADDRVIDLGESDAKAIYAAMLDAALWDDA